jgi:hypothetical protein
MPTKAHFLTAAVALAAFAAVALFQKKVMAIPVIGDYLPN